MSAAKDVCPACGNDREAWYHGKVDRREGFGGADCPSCLFSAFGDMCTLRELRDMGPLGDPEQEATRQEYVAAYEANGLHPDLDPSSFTLTISAAPDGELQFSDLQPVYVTRPEEAS